MPPRDCWTHIANQQLSRRQLLAIAGAAAGGALLASCGRDAFLSEPLPHFDVPDPSILTRGEFIAPKDTDAAIDQALESHYVVGPVAPVRGRLFLFLPATTFAPTLYRLISDQAARNGFHVITLRYPNSDTVQSLCGTDPDAACFEDIRLEVIYGMDRSPKVNITRANSIENRLLKTLAFLDNKYPSEGWSAFIDSGTPKWASIVVAGHSQGGGHAGLIARDHLVARVAMLSSPVDHVGPPGRQVGSSQPAAWLLGTHVTPSDRYYSFGHDRDENNNWALQWNALAPALPSFGTIVNIDTGTTPYTASHLLTTDAQPRPITSNLRNHLSTATDSATPLTSAGQPAFASAWQYLCFA